jgi:hypothetical protein
MKLRSLLTVFVFAILPLTVAACSTTKGPGQLQVGMTPDEAVQTMGEPDLKDNVADPAHSGANVLRFTWIDSGKSAVFSSNQKIASIQNVDLTTKKDIVEEQQAAASPPPPFDPINTPLNYLFFPVKAGFTYLGAGLNCVAGDACRKPQIAPPS